MSSLRASATIEPPGLSELLTGDGRSLPARLKAEIFREIDRLELVLRQISEVRSRIWMLTFASESASGPRLPTWQSPADPDGGSSRELAFAFFQPFVELRRRSAHKGVGGACHL
jgi:hypothetical protein